MTNYRDDHVNNSKQSRQRCARRTSNKSIENRECKIRQQLVQFIVHTWIQNRSVNNWSIIIARGKEE
jgi:IS1 family transposase